MAQSRILAALPSLTVDPKRKRGPKLILDKQTYSIKVRNKNEIVWRCVMRPCPGSARSDLDFSNPRADKAHTLNPVEVCMNK